jgi:hypothetical protein
MNIDEFLFYAYFHLIFNSFCNSHPSTHPSKALSRKRQSPFSFITLTVNWQLMAVFYYLSVETKQFLAPLLWDTKMPVLFIIYSPIAYSFDGGIIPVLSRESNDRVGKRNVHCSFFMEQWLKITSSLNAEQFHALVLLL